MTAPRKDPAWWNACAFCPDDSQPQNGRHAGEGNCFTAADFPRPGPVPEAAPPGPRRMPGARRQGGSLSMVVEMTPEQHVALEIRPARAVGEVDEAEVRIRAFMAGAKAENTRRAYADDWRRFETWCAAEDLPSLPAHPETICRFLDSLVLAGYVAHSGERRSYSAATLSRFMVSISVAHTRAGFGPTDNPIKHPAVQECWEGIRRSIGSAQRPKAAATTTIIRSMVAGLPDPVAPLPGAADRLQLAGLRDRALVLVGFAGGFRRSELAALVVEDLEDVDEGMDILIRRSKTDQAGKGRTILVCYAPEARDCPVRALRAWLAASAITEGPIFRKVDRHGHVGTRALSGQAVADVVKARAMAAGRDPSKFAGHSLRRGHVTSAAKAGASRRKIKAQTGHHSDRMVDAYTEDASRSEGNSSAAVWTI